MCAHPLILVDPRAGGAERWGQSSTLVFLLLAGPIYFLAGAGPVYCAQQFLNLEWEAAQMSLHQSWAQTLLGRKTPSHSEKGRLSHPTASFFIWFREP